MSAGSVLWSELEESRPTGHRHPEGLLTVKLRAYSQSLLHFQPYRLTRLSESETSKLVSSLETAPSRGSRIGRGRYNRILYVVLVVLSSRPALDCCLWSDVAATSRLVGSIAQCRGRGRAIQY
jgi:hypothetical protein